MFRIPSNISVIKYKNNTTQINKYINNEKKYNIIISK